MDDTTDNNSSPPPPAAAAASSRTISERLALTLQTIDQLTTIFSLPPHMARQAVETVGPEDVTQCYNWILDNYQSEDCGGPVVPKLDCPHLEGCVDGNVLKKFQLLQRHKIDDCNDECCNEAGEDENIFQLTCQHYSSSLMRRPASRKRLRSEDCSEDNNQQSVPTGQLKRDEDYGNTNETSSSSSPATTNKYTGKEIEPPMRKLAL